MRAMFRRAPRPRRKEPFALPPLWSKQREIIRSVGDHRLTAVPAAHGLGKTMCVACLAAQWVMNPEHPTDRTIAVVIAPTHKQIVLGVISHLRDMSRRGEIPGRIGAGTSPAWNLDGRDVLVALSPPRGSGGFLQGVHAEHLLLIFDEAAEIEQGHWDAAMSLITGEKNKAVAIGNPTIPDSPFYSACEDTDSRWNVIRMPVSCSPAFTGERVDPAITTALPTQEWVDLMRHEWSPGEQAARLDARFPSASSLALFDVTKLDIRRGVEPPGRADRLGVDVAGAGTDATVVYAWRAAEEGSDTPNGVAWDATPPGLRQESDRHAQAEAIARTAKALDCRRVIVDGFGVGGEMAPQIAEYLGGEAAVRAVNTGNPAGDNDRYANLRAEMHWQFRRCPPALLNPDERLIKELRAVRQVLGVERRWQVERKADITERLQHSPDDADALLLAAAMPPPPLVVIAGLEEAA